MSLPGGAPGRHPLRGRVSALGLALAAFAPACASLSQERASDVTGCYQFRWDAGAKALGLPWGMVLHEDPLEEGWLIGQEFEGVRRAETATSATGRADHPLGYWRWASEDSVEVGYPGGGAGFVLTLAPEGQKLVGQGRPVGDVLLPGEPSGPRPPEPVVAHRVLCGAT